jgi:hypothetical protein
VPRSDQRSARLSNSRSPPFAHANQHDYENDPGGDQERAKSPSAKPAQ